MGKPEVTQPLDPDQLFGFDSFEATQADVPMLHFESDKGTQQLDHIDGMPVAEWHPEGTGATRHGSVGSFRRHLPQLAFGVVAIAGAIGAYFAF
jgi:hypothetical protein